MRTKLIPKEYLGAFKAGHRASARDFIDEELSFVLLAKVDAGCEESRVALEWLTKFNNEYYKGVVKKGDAKAFHCEEQARLECYRRSYRQRMDVHINAVRMKKPEDF